MDEQDHGADPAKKATWQGKKKKVEETQTTDKERNGLLCDVRTCHFRKYQTRVLVLVSEQSLVQSDFYPQALRPYISIYFLT